MASHIRSEESTPDLNSDVLSHWLGQDNVGYAMMEGQRMLVLLDMGTNVNMITPECAATLGLPVGPLTDLCKGGVMVDQPFDYQS